jgi:diguanylate cyclase (GGDEF)-like protein
VTAPAESSGGGGASPILVVVLVLAVLGLAAAVIALARRRVPAARPHLAPSPTSAGPAGSPLTGTTYAGVGAGASGGAAGPSPVTHELLEVSRQLTAAASRGDVRRAIVRGALGLVPADAAALVGTGPPLTVDAESHPGTLVPDRLADGLIGRVAETGEQIVQVSATEPAVRNLPAAMIALPLVDRGRVDAVLLLLRAGERTFAEQEVRTLRALAPMAAAVLGSERQTQSAIEESLQDPLTGAGNRRRLDRDLAAAVEDSGRSRRPISLAIVDLDHFKRVNDTYGHPAGDALLRAVVERARTALRPGDGLYRFGGEEFCLVLGGAEPAEALEVAERVRVNIAAAPFDVGGAERLTATASIGVATTTGGDVATLLASADGALYESKEKGRNRVTAAETG